MRNRLPVPAACVRAAHPRGAQPVMRSLLLMLLLLALLLAAPAQAQPSEPARRVYDEREVEAAYIINFIRYARWPESVTSADQPYVVAVLGPTSLARALSEAAAQAGSVHGRPIQVRRVTGVDRSVGDAARDRLARQLAGVHAVVVAREQLRLADEVVTVARHRPLLTIGIGALFAQRGGMLSLIRVDGRVLFTANLEAVMQSPVVVSSKVLKLARPLPPEGSE